MPHSEVNGQQAVGTTSDPNTSSTTYVDVPEMSITMTTSGAPVLLAFNCIAKQNTANKSIYFVFEIDGVDEVVSERGAQYPSVNTECRCSFAYLKTGLGAGSHTFKVQFKVDGGTATLPGTTRNLIVIDLG